MHSAIRIIASPQWPLVTVDETVGANRFISNIKTETQWLK